MSGLYTKQGNEYFLAYTPVSSSQKEKEANPPKIAYLHIFNFARQEEIVKPHWYSRRRTRWGKWQLVSMTVNDEMIADWRIDTTVLHRRVWHPYFETDFTFDLGGTRLRRETYSVAYEGCRIEDDGRFADSLLDKLNNGEIP